MTGGGTANATIANAAINNNLDNGVAVTATAGGNINAAFMGGAIDNYSS